jgi:hypothetical protein
MVIYLDLLFIFNSFINAIFIYAIELCYKEKISLKRILIGGFIGGLLIVGFLFDYYIYYILKIIGGLIIGFIGFKGSSLKIIVKTTSFYIINFASIGLINSFNISEWYLFILSVVGIILIYFIENNRKSLIFINSYKYNISVSFGNTRLKLEGFLDTGNFSKFDDLPIIYISDKYQQNYSVYKLVNINTINGVSYSKSYKPSSFIIEVNHKKLERDVLVVFTKLKDFDCLLNAELFI